MYYSSVYPSTFAYSSYANPSFSYPFSYPFSSSLSKYKYDYKCCKPKYCCKDDALFASTTLARGLECCNKYNYREGYGANYYSPLLATPFMFPFAFGYPYYW
jgi:hypothetical protein